MNTGHGHCLNCSIPLSNEFDFCPKCGQKADTHRLNAKHLSHDIIHYFTHADKSIFRLVWLLLKQPGTTVREYLQGKRKKYFPPVNFFLISVAIMAISARIFKTLNMNFMRTKNASKITAIGNEIVYQISTNIKWVYIAFIPVFTFLFWIFYTRRRYNYIEHLVAGLYWNGLIVLFLAFVISPLMYVFDTLDAFYNLSLLFIGVLTLYYAIAYFRLLEYHSAWRFIRSLIISTIVSLLSILLFIILIRMVYVINGQ